MIPLAGLDPASSVIKPEICESWPYVQITEISNNYDLYQSRKVQFRVIGKGDRLLTLLNSLPSILNGEVE